MPTATSTLTRAAPSSIRYFKGSIPVTTALPLTPPSTTASTLRTLYNRAARAFLLRDFSLTYCLIGSAFSLIHSPDGLTSALADERRKWDILRITLECTIYFSPPSPQDKLPESLRSLQLQSPQAFLRALHGRSLALFSPTTELPNINPAHLPSSVLITLIYSSLRLECPDCGRIMVEDWLSRRDVYSQRAREEQAASYEKVLELYCLQILPKLEQWDYAQEFLEYESELPVTSRDKLKHSLRSLQIEVMSSRQPSSASSSPPSPEVDHSPRSSSPAPSSSSSSSSLSTASNNTIVPPGRRVSQSNSSHLPSKLANASSTSIASDSTATPRQSFQRPVLRPRTADSSTASFSSSLSSVARLPTQTSTVRSANITFYALIKATLGPYMTTPNLTTFFLLFVAFPLISLTLRARHHRRQASIGTSAVANNALSVRKRLHGSKEIDILSRAWNEVVRVVCDTVKMAGSGLV